MYVTFPTLKLEKPCLPTLPTLPPVISQIARASLCELAVTLTIHSAICCFVATPLGSLVLIKAIFAQTILNTTFRCVFAVFSSDRMTQISEIYCSMFFARFTGVPGQTLIHEMGHALAATALYKRARPFIEIYPFQGGRTSFNGTHLSALGEIVGKNKARLIVTASGPLFTLLISWALLTIALQIRKTHPQVSLYLQTAALVDYLVHIRYALSALWTSPQKLSHDFVQLAHFGLHPLAAAVTIAALPVLIFRAFS